jgi:lathosterol oxidase
MPLCTTFGQLDDLPTMFLLLWLGTLLLYLGVAGASQCLMWIKAKSVPGTKIGSKQIGKAISLSLVSIGCNSVIITPVVVLVVRGSTRAYFTVSDYGWGYLLFSIVFLVLFTDTLVYWIHRTLHARSLYKLVHRYHHEFRAPTPWASLAFHPLDAFAQALPYHLFAFLFPIHVGVYAAALMVVTLWTFLIHEPPLFFPEGWPNFAAHHAIHHTCNKYNYGQFFSFWDRIGNTYRHPKTDVHAAGLGRTP